MVKSTSWSADNYYLVQHNSLGIKYREIIGALKFDWHMLPNHFNFDDMKFKHNKHVSVITAVTAIGPVAWSN